MTSLSHRSTAHPPARETSLATAAAATAAALLAWGVGVTLAAGSGLLGRLWMPAVALLVAAGIIIPTLIYVASPALQRLARAVGLRAITAFHIWRIPAALLFVWYGAAGALPPLFWILAGVGDLIAGAWALMVVRRPGATLAHHQAMHRFGSADFLVAVGTGLAYTLLLDPRMALITTLPMALIPLFGVGISGTTHIIAFHLIRTEASRAAGPPARA